MSDLDPGSAIGLEQRLQMSIQEAYQLEGLIKLHLNHYESDSIQSHSNKRIKATYIAHLNGLCAPWDTICFIKDVILFFWQGGKSKWWGKGVRWGLAEWGGVG